jgi:valyl-tRNA synthetase
MKKHDRELVGKFEIVKEIVSAVRTIRKEKQIPQKEKTELLIRDEHGQPDTRFFIPVIKKLCNLSDVSLVNSKQDGSASFMVGTTEFYVPLSGMIDTEGGEKKIEADLVYYRGFLESVMKKLGNERFVNNAPASVLELERKKKSDTEIKIRSLERSIESAAALSTGYG